MRTALPAAARTRRVTVATVLLALAGVLAAAPAAPAATPAAEFDPSPTRERATTAEIVTPTTLRTRPGGPARGRLRPQSSWSAGPVVLLVLRGRLHNGERWIEVRLAGRPNGDSAWIPADRARLKETPWRITLDRASRTLRVWREGRLVRRWRGVIGRPSTPTPAGLFAIYEKQRQTPANGFFGPWILHLTAHSNVLFDFGGGKGRVALHGRSGQSLADPLGSARSSGCIRIGNGPVSWLARRVPLGTPFEIR